MTDIEQASSSRIDAASVAVVETSVGAELARVVEATPEAPALYWLTPDGHESLTWAELYSSAGGAAERLRELDPQGGRVALVAYNSLDWIIAMYGCVLAGRSVVPISPAATDAEAGHMLSLAQVSTILAVERAGQDETLVRMTNLAKGMPLSPSVRDIAEVARPAESVIRPAAVAPGDEFLLQFTSGTTGVPKAAVLSHRAAINSARVYAEACAARPGETWLSPLPLFHVGGSVSGLLVALTQGSAYIIIDRFSPQVAARAIREIRPALVGLVPTMIIDMLGAERVAASDFESVRLVVGGATAVDPGLIADMESRLGITFMVAYGQSEAPMMAASAPTDSADIRTRTTGRCLAGRDYRIRDRDGRIVPFGEVGELCVRGPLTMTGYLRPDGSIDPAADGEGWRGTGDLCSMATGGVLTFHGRIRELIIRGGLNVFPAEVERVLTEYESVSEAAVFGVPDARLGERVVVAILPAPGNEVDPANLAAFAAGRLSHYKQPSEWIMAKTLPRTSTGKIRKHQLRKWYEEGVIRQMCGAAPTV